MGLLRNCFQLKHKLVSFLKFVLSRSFSIYNGFSGCGTPSSSSAPFTCAARVLVCKKELHSCNESRATTRHIVCSLEKRSLNPYISELCIGPLIWWKNIWFFQIIRLGTDTDSKMQFYIGAATAPTYYYYCGPLVKNSFGNVLVINFQQNDRNALYHRPIKLRHWQKITQKIL